MIPRFQTVNPADAVEEAFFRIQREQMADVPILNPALSVKAVDFQRWQGHCRQDDGPDAPPGPVAHDHRLSPPARQYGGVAHAPAWGCAG